MTRPQIIRADTIDLQDQDSPSAKDHTRQPAHPAPLGDGPPAPHQADALKHVEQEMVPELHTRSPRHSQDLSNKELQLLHEDGDTYGSNDGSGLNQDLHNLQRNGSSVGLSNSEEMDMGDAEDDSMDDDMMDKISSSPSIDDGGYHLPLPWPDRGNSLLPTSTLEEDSPPVPPKHNTLSSSLSFQPPNFPLIYPQRHPEHEQVLSDDHHQEGGFVMDQEDQLHRVKPHGSEDRGQLNPSVPEQRISHFHEDLDELQDSFDADFDPNDFHHLLLPADDPLLDNSFDDAPLSPLSSESSSPASRSSWEETVPDETDDDTNDISYSPDSRFVDSGWGGECLRETEDIDFEFVYALHTFVATVEGQANATKGDTMVLLDDSNSYWWLVRVVKDSSIGYLPAEHIETPTERLARLNKHRNIDLSQTMLGDNPEKSKNPLKKAMRRHNAKTVQFTAPTYVEASDQDYSTDEEEQDDGEYVANEAEGSELRDDGQDQGLDESATVEPLKARNDPKEPAGDMIMVSEPREAGIDQIDEVEKARTSDEIAGRLDDGTPGKSRNGTVRNTDSFFKDDTVETRKINLTPSLLRDDSSGLTAKSNEVKELKPRGSLDSLEKVVSPQEKVKEDRKRKEKKGMLNGLFKRKDKKSKGQDEDMEDIKKTSGEISRQSPQPKESLESISQEVQAPKPNLQPQPQRQTSKLQKPPPTGRSVSVNRSNSSSRSPSTKAPVSQEEVVGLKPSIVEQQNTAAIESIRAPAVAAEPNGPIRLVQPEQRQWEDDTPSPLRVRSPEHSREEPSRAEPPQDANHGMFAPITDVLQSSPSSSEPKLEKAQSAKQRMAMDEFDSSSDTEENIDPHPRQEDSDSRGGMGEAATERLSESPVQVAPQDTRHTPNPPTLMIDTSSQEDPSNSPVSPISSPELIEVPHEGNVQEETPASPAHSPNNTPTWSDASLRAYLEDDSEIRDLLVVVHDKSDVKPAAADHPLVKNLFKEENRKLGEISDQLDGLLGGLLARKSKLLAPQATKTSKSSA